MLTDEERLLLPLARACESLRSIFPLSPSPCWRRVFILTTAVTEAS